MKSNILLTNDDGISSPALTVAENTLREISNCLTVIAPDRERSASGHAITMHHPLRIVPKGQDRFALDGTPADCVYLGVASICEERPSFVVSGPNKGPNLGTDVFYSGTVAGAAEGYARGLFGIALSTPRDADKKTWAAAAEFVGKLISALIKAEMSHGLINVNFPMVENLRGYRWTRLGRRTYKEEAVHRVDPKGRSYYWIGGPGLSDFEGAVGEDVEAVRQGFVSMTPMKMDMTEESFFPTLKEISLEGFNPIVGSQENHKREYWLNK